MNLSSKSRQGKRIAKSIAQNAVHLPISVSSASEAIEGCIACEHVRHIDLNERKFTKVHSLQLTDYLDISDTLVALFDFR